MVPPFEPSPFSCLRKGRVIPYGPEPEQTSPMVIRGLGLVGPYSPDFEVRGRKLCRVVMYAPPSSETITKVR